MYVIILSEQSLYIDDSQPETDVISYLLSQSLFLQYALTPGYQASVKGRFVGFSMQFWAVLNTFPIAVLGLILLRLQFN